VLDAVNRGVSKSELRTRSPNRPRSTTLREIDLQSGRRCSVREKNSATHRRQNAAGFVRFMTDPLVATETQSGTIAKGKPVQTEPQGNHLGVLFETKPPPQIESCNREAPI